MIDINLDECTTAIDKIVLNAKLFNNSFKAQFIPDAYLPYASIKSYKNLSSITTLEIKGKNIIKIHKTIFLNLINLVYIDLSDNHLLKISKNFKLFKSLKTLKLNNNKISFIPSFIGELNQLEHLSLYRNLIRSIPTSIQELNKLKYFDISSNKLEDIPIEFGYLISLNVLHIDCNYFTQIPTTFCNLKNLNDLCFDWLEFVEPPYYKNIKDSIGKIIISFILKALQNMLKKDILYCSFQQFVDEMSVKKSENEKNSKNINFDVADSLLNRSGINNELKNSQFCGSSITIKSSANIINNKFLKIFNAIEGGYYGIIKSMLEGEYSYEFLIVKNIESRTPLSYCMSKNNDLIDLFLSKIKEQKIEISYTYLFKAIKLRNPELVKKLINLGINANSYDEQGKGVLHILFSIFNKNISKCILIGNFLLSFNLKLNKLDNEGWGPIHLAAKRGSKECFLWVIEKNKKLRKEGKEEFDLDLRGKNDWTPLHLVVYGLRIEETMILLEHGCDIFARNSEAKTPKQVWNSNYVFSKILSHYENVTLYNYYIYQSTSLESTPYKKKRPKIIKKRNSNKNNNDNSSSFNDDNIIINNSVTIVSTLFKKSIKNDKRKENVSKSNNIIKEQKIKLKKEKILNKKNNSINLFLSIKQNLFRDSNKKNNALNQTPNNKIINTKEEHNENTINNNTLYFSTNNVYEKESKEIKEYNFENHEEIKEKLFFIDITNFERIQNFTKMILKKKVDVNDLEFILDNIIKENSLDVILFLDICNYSIENLIYGILPALTKLLKYKNIKSNYFIKNELEHTIKILENLQKNQKIYKKSGNTKKIEIEHLSPINKKLSEKKFESEDDMIFRDSEMNEFDDNEKIHDNSKLDEIFKKTDNNINHMNQKINKIKNIKLSKGNILNIDIKKVKALQKNKKKK